MANILNRISLHRASHTNQPKQNQLRGRWAAASLLAVTFWGVPLLTQPLPVLAQEQPQRHLRTLTVTGRGQERIPTTITQVSLGVEAQGKTAQSVQQEIARRSSAVIALLRSRNVERLETTGISLSPNYSYTNNRQQLIGYNGRNTVSFRIATDRAGTLLDDAIQAGASNINGVSFVAADEAITAARQQALRKATVEAQTQAKAVLSALNLQPGEIVNIVIDNANIPQPQPVAYRMQEGLAVRAAPTTPVIGGEQQVEAAVTLRISY